MCMLHVYHMNVSICHMNLYVTHVTHVRMYLSHECVYMSHECLCHIWHERACHKWVCRVWQIHLYMTYIFMNIYIYTWHVWRTHWWHTHSYVTYTFILHIVYTIIRDVNIMWQMRAFPRLPCDIHIYEIYIYIYDIHDIHIDDLHNHIRRTHSCDRCEPSRDYRRQKKLPPCSLPLACWRPLLPAWSVSVCLA